MTVVFIVAVLGALAFPSFRELGRRTGATDVTNQLLGDLNTARQEAVKRGVRVQLINLNGLTSNDWATGWQIRADNNRNGNFDTLIRAAGPAAAGYRVRSFAGVPVAPIVGNGVVVFDGTGGMVSSQAFDINVCVPNGTPADGRRVTVTASGMSSARRNTTGSPAPAC